MKFFQRQTNSADSPASSKDAGQVSREVMVSVMEDTVEERNKALRLAAENQQLATIFQQFDEGIVQVNPDGTVNIINASARQFFGIDLDDGQTIHFIELFDAKNQAAIQQALDKILKKESTKPLNFHQPTTNDHPVVFELSFSSLLDERKTVFGIVAVIRDVSQQFRQQEELRLIIEQAPNALIMADSQGQIMVSNAQALRLFGYSAEELVGQSVELLVPDVVRAKHPQLRSRFVQAPKARAMGAGRDLTARRKDGSEVAVEIGLNPIDTRLGQFVIASVVDISERQRAKLALEEVNSRLRQKNKEMEQFIYTVSHDLKSPLVTIGGFANRLKESLGPTLDDKQQHQLQRISANVDHMEALLNDLLHLSRLIRQKPDKQHLDTKALVQSVIDTLEDQITATQSSITIRDPLPSIYGNEKLVFQCLQNLIANAIQYRHGQRPLEITVHGEDDSHTYIRVSDNGIGIEEQYFERIFQIFERLDIGQGTGVGLAIVKTIMEKHDGSVVLSSTPGIGSTFTLHFPKAQDSSP